MEPWDGPAAVAFTDGLSIGAVLDRNGLRPGRYVVTDDDRVIMASEVGALDVAPERVVAKGRLEPGKMFLVDLVKGQIINDSDIKTELATAKPYGEWLEQNMVSLADLPPAPEVPGPDHDTLLQRQIAFGYTQSKISSTSSGRWAKTAKRRSARWEPTRRWPCSPRKPSPSSTISSSSSPR